ncbi:MAG: cupredoxin family copper-binding protein [Nitrososphaerota archaeon]|nr:cupredoxin family copper-binding protein [Nitrososphaerota archaeon]
MVAGLAFIFSAPTAAAQGTVSVSISNFAFNPSAVTVVIGVNNTVTWTNTQSGVPHTVTADDGSWGSGQLSTGGTYTHTFSTAGTFTYHCAIHTFMKGTVIVKGTGTSTTTTSAASSSTTASSTSASPTTTTSAATSTTATPSSSGGVPEFPFQGLLLAAVTLGILASYLLLRQTRNRGRAGVPL